MFEFSLTVNQLISKCSSSEIGGRGTYHFGYMISGGFLSQGKVAIGYGEFYKSIYKHPFEFNLSLAKA